MINGVTDGLHRCNNCDPTTIFDQMSETVSEALLEIILQRTLDVIFIM